MPFIHFSPITVQTLNNGIDANLIMSGAFNQILNVNFVSSNTLGTDLVLGTKAEAADQTRIILWEDGTIDFFVLDNVGVSEFVARFQGIVADPYLDMRTHRIEALAQATTDMDAVPITKMWGTWTPTLTWGTADPAAPTVTARYCQIGKTVYFNFFVSSNDSNACTSLTATLPVAPKANGVYNTFTGFEYRATVGVTDPRPYNLQSGSLISFWGFLTGVDAQVIQINVSGFYEVA